ncbi:MAG: hypothetical protein ACK5Y7_18535 [Betaproteobacteria bacterium]|nr:hypothetical protein [Rubrivivax sp.]
MKAPQHPVAWVAPQPFWRPGSAEGRSALAQPQILRFANDQFMEELLAMLQRDPQQLPNFTAQPETWRTPHAGPLPAPEQWVERPPARLLPLMRKAQAKKPLPALLPKVMLPEKPLKLFQPAHQRHYLVAGALVCQAPGLPDRAIDPARQRVGFVVRRLFPKTKVDRRLPLPQPTTLADWEEHAWVLVGKGGEWRRVGNAGAEAEVAAPLAGEERLPMFPSRYAEAQGQPRRLFIGSVPVGRRETYQAGQQKASATDVDPDALPARIVQLHVDVLAPWKAQVNMGRGSEGERPGVIFDDPKLPLPASVPTDGGRPVDFKQLYRLRSELQVASWYLLLGLRAYLETHVPEYTDWLNANPSGAPPAGTPIRALHDRLARVATDPGLRVAGSDRLSLAHADTGYAVSDIAVDLPDALRRIRDDSTLDIALTGVANGAQSAFAIPMAGVAGNKVGWPGFLFLFVDPWFAVATPYTAAEAPPPGSRDFGAEALQAQIDKLQEAVKAIPARAGVVMPEPTLASMQPADMREAWYVMRLVYDRPDCAPFEGPVTSRATAPFQMAGFFDPDAPARPIRIGLPVDISPAGLRKFDKNAVFMMSDMLCGHVDRFKGITFGDLVLSVLPWPFHKDLSVPDKGPCKQGDMSLGVMCSLSIPIITICALILLMVIVALLDLIFRWLPLFVVCFPLPGFKGKK